MTASPMANQRTSFFAALLLLAATTTAMAQTPAKTASAADQGSGGLEEIVVTARKTEEKLQDIPLTVSAFSAEALKNYNVLRIIDLNQLTPGMNFQEGSGRGGAGRFFIRGLTGGVAGTARASTFVDGVYVANSVSNILFGEMERAEVLLGPQSAQFGRATFGGALNLVTKNPKNVWSGSFAVSGASDNERNFDGWIGGPLIQDKLLGSLYVGTQHYGGPSLWTAPPDILHPNGVHQGGTDTESGSIKLIFTPLEGLRFQGRFAYAKDHDDPAFSNILLPQYRTAVYQQIRRDCVQATATTAAVCTPQATSQPAYYFSGTINPGNAFKGGFPGGLRNYDQYPDSTYRNTTQRVTLETTYVLPKGHNLRLTLADNKETQPFGNFTDSDFTAFPSSRFSPSYQTIRDKSAELRLDSSHENRLRYSVGAYYLTLKTNLDASSFADYLCNTVCVPTTPAALFRTDVLTGWTGSIGGSVNRFNPSPFVTRNSVLDASYFIGVFYDFTDRWTASFEGRSQKETIYNYNISSRYTATVAAGPSALPLLDPANANKAVIGGQLSFTSFLPRVNAQFKITPDAQVYATYSKGNNPGGINTAAQIGQPLSGTTEAQRSIQEEVLKNYEIGFKSQWLDHRLRVNGAIYQMKWDNLQNSATYFLNGVFFGVTENRGAAKIDGFGIDAEFAPTKDWTFRGQLSYNRGTYERFCSIQLANLLYGPASLLPGAALLGADPRCLAAGSGGQFNTRAQLVSGNELETAPKKTASVGFEYHTMVLSDWTLTPRGNLQYSDGQWESEMNLAKSPSWTMLELGLGLDKGPVSFEVFCRNCNNEDAPQRTTRLTDPYASNAPVASGGLGYNQTIGNNPRRPRQYGARFAWKF